MRCAFAPPTPLHKTTTTNTHTHSLVSGSVPRAVQGEAQGAINGVRALTEGFGPLCFGLLMHASEGSAVPGAPYLAGAVVTLAALTASYRIPDEVRALLPCAGMGCCCCAFCRVALL